MLQTLEVGAYFHVTSLSTVEKQFPSKMEAPSDNGEKECPCIDYRRLSMRMYRLGRPLSLEIGVLKLRVVYQESLRLF